MQKIDKTTDKILSIKYKAWLDKLEKEGKVHDGNYRYYYDDIVMNLYKCQSGVCAYTEMHICIPELYVAENWIKGRHKISEDASYKRNDHFGELEHFDADAKKLKYWDWDNLFMIHSKINDIKKDRVVVSYLKPDLPDYSPDKYFDYDFDTHRYRPNTDINDEKMIQDIQYMIDNVLSLNNGEVRRYRTNYINNIIARIETGESFVIDEFFTAVKWTLESK